MNDNTIHLVRKILRLLDEIGPMGLEELTVKDQLDLAAGFPVTTTEKDLAFQTCDERGWMKSYRQEVTGRIRWYLSDTGRAARSGL